MIYFDIIILKLNASVSLCFLMKMQMFFSDTKQKQLCWKIAKSERFLAVLREYIIFNVK